MIESLKLGEKLKIESISIPAISSGVYCMPKNISVEVLFNSALKYLDLHPNTNIKYIRFIDQNSTTVKLF